MTPLMIEVSPGELFDKITVLELKNERISEFNKLRNIRTELTHLLAVRDKSVSMTPALETLAAELKKVNDAVWQLEDRLRMSERDGDFGPRFIELARSLTMQKDRRSEIKRKVDEQLESNFLEEKQYAA